MSTPKTHPTPPPGCHPIPEFLHQAIEAERQEWQAVKTGRLRQSPLFGFCRVLRARPEYGGLEAEAALAKVGADLKLCGTSLEELFPDCEDPVIYFAEGWKNTNLIGMLDRALCEADIEQACTGTLKSTKYTRFVLTAKHLQLRKGSEPFILSVDAFAKKMGVSKQMISIYRRQAEADCFLKMVVPGDHGSHRAARYIYIGQLY